MNEENNNLNNQGKTNEVKNDFTFFQPVDENAPVENSNVENLDVPVSQVSDNVEILNESGEVASEPIQQTPVETIPEVLQTPVAESVGPTTTIQQNEVVESVSNVQNYNQDAYEQTEEKKQLNPKFFILIGIIIALIIGGVLFLKKGGLGIGGENLTQDFSGKYNTYLNQTIVYGNTVFHKIRYYYDKSMFTENKSISVNYYKFTSDKYPSGSQVITYISGQSELDENSSELLTRTAYGNYKDFLKRHSDRVKSNKGSKITTKKIGGLEYKYFKGSITYSDGQTKYFVSFETKLNDMNYYSVNYEGAVDIDNSILKGFLNAKIEKYNSMEELKVGD